MPPRFDQRRQLVKADARDIRVDARDLLCGLFVVNDRRNLGNLRNVGNLLGGNLLVHGDNNTHTANDRQIRGDPCDAVLARHDQALAAKAARKQLRSERIDVLGVVFEAETAVCAVHFLHEQRLVAEFFGARIEHFFQVFVNINRIILILRH